MLLLFFSGIGKLRWILSIVPALSITIFFIVTALIVGTKISEIAISDTILFALKIMLTYLCAASLFATTNYYDIVKAYEFIRVPIIITAVTSFIFRWFLLISEEAHRMNTARIVRGGSLRKTKDKLRDIIQLSISLIIRSYYRSDRIAYAMECRGFQGKLYRGKHLPISKIQLIILFLFLLLFYFIMVLGR
ncbi:MAG: energy-coupling factor transporter transmembrane component T [Armatimonadota bacterium]